MLGDFEAIIKKVDRLLFRDTNLTDSYKVRAEIILRKLISFMESTVKDSQCGLRRRSLTLVKIFLVVVKERQKLK
jgi:hypothetical protein